MSLFDRRVFSFFFHSSSLPHPRLFYYAMSFLFSLICLLAIYLLSSGLACFSLSLSLTHTYTLTNTQHLLPPSPSSSLSAYLPYLPVPPKWPSQRCPHWQEHSHHYSKNGPKCIRNMIQIQEYDRFQRKNSERVSCFDKFPQR